MGGEVSREEGVSITRIHRLGGGGLWPDCLAHRARAGSPARKASQQKIHLPHGCLPPKREAIEGRTEEFTGEPCGVEWGRALFFLKIRANCRLSRIESSRSARKPLSGDKKIIPGSHFPPKMSKTSSYFRSTEVILPLKRPGKNVVCLQDTGKMFPFSLQTCHILMSVLPPCDGQIAPKSRMNWGETRGVHHRNSMKQGVFSGETPRSCSGVTSIFSIPRHLNLGCTALKGVRP